MWPWDDTTTTQRKPAQTLSKCSSREVRPLPSRAFSAPPCIPPISQTNRQHKRQLSESDAPVSPKRSRTGSVECRDQTLSKPPSPSKQNDFEEQVDVILDWASAFTVVEPATYAPPEASEPFVFEVFSQWHVFEDLCGQAITDVTGMCVLWFGCFVTHGCSNPTAATADAPSTSATTAAPTAEDVPLTFMSFTMESTSHDSSPLSTPGSPDRHTLEMLPSHVDAAEYATQAHSQFEPFPSPPRTPPPTFEHAIAHPDDPPSYTPNDQHSLAELDYFPPPPYCPVGEKSGPAHGALLDADALVGLFPSIFEKHEYLGSSPQHFHVAQAGLPVVV